MGQIHLPSMGVKETIDELVNRDRLPSENSKEGLLLLRDAWCEYDIAVMLASKFKRLSKCVFAAQLVVAWLIMCAATLEVGFLPVDLIGQLKYGKFFLGFLATALVSVESFFNATSRWRQLRSSANNLETAIWFYRTRSGDFELEHDNRDSSRPEKRFSQTINEWRDDLVSS